MEGVADRQGFFVVFDHLRIVRMLVTPGSPLNFNSLGARCQAGEGTSGYLCGVSKVREATPGEG